MKREKREKKNINDKKEIKKIKNITWNDESRRIKVIINENIIKNIKINCV